MTLAELIKKASIIQAQLTTASIPLKYEGHDVDIDFDIAGNYEKGYVINVIIK